MDPFCVALRHLAYVWEVNGQSLSLAGATRRSAILGVFFPIPGRLDL